ncbi:MAG TPA: MoaD/ThiS family protein [Holophagaceae bacterium]|nr:MoaD/ThiS family protein [Holophagaceae bacterium]
MDATLPRNGMPKVSFTANLQRHVAVPPSVVPGSSVAEALDAVFAEHPLARGYVLDEHGALRYHMIIFIDGEAISDRRHLTDAVGERSEIFVMQALSGG